MMSAQASSTSQNETKESGRRWARYPVAHTPIQIIAGDNRFEGVVVDESIGGIGITTNETVTIVEGEEVRLVYHGADVSGQVSRVVPIAEGGSRISISWEKKESPQADLPPIAYFKYGPLLVVCTAESGEPDSSRKITLWNGKQFDVATEQVVFRTKRARLSELQQMGDQCGMTARLYGLDTAGDARSLPEQIIAFETAGR